MDKKHERLRTHDSSETKPPTYPKNDVINKKCEACKGRDDICAKCKKTIREIVNTFWWD